ncbi:hypothetical protein ACIO93_12110 [Streptomyces sp. NPDC087903]|uniref:Imm32 family immunity protein n=1 Tax=Streptomyces sp. NPDC087903 TaxID=3365819 RepID=UPI0037FF353F
MRVVADPVFGEVDVTASAEELSRLAGAVAAGEGWIRSTAPADGGTLAAIEVRTAPGSGVRTEVDASRHVLVISGGSGARAVLADNLRAMAETSEGGHLHIDHFPDHPYLVEGSVPLVVNSPHGGMPA